MDFVVAGLGFGALVVVIGFVIRDLGPLLWKRLGHGAFSKTDEERERWHDLCQAIATNLTVAGCFVLIATVAAVLIGASDSVGEIVVLAASIVALVGIVVSISLVSREYQQSTPTVTFNLGNISNQTALVSNPFRTDPSTPEVSSTRRVEKSAPTTEQDAASATTLPESSPAPEPAISELFDATKLLPTELDEESKSSATATTVVDSSEDQAVQAGSDAGHNSNARSMSAKPEQDRQVTITPAISEPAPANTGTFRSKLLADIGAPEPPETANGSFASSLLADVERPESSDESDFQSPVLADLADEVVATEITSPEERVSDSKIETPKADSTGDEASESSGEAETSDAENGQTIIQR